ncbi:MAG: hypothetical protein AB7K09_10080 [Planctomycetota bacterium]
MSTTGSRQAIVWIFISALTASGLTAAAMVTVVPDLVRAPAPPNLPIVAPATTAPPLQTQPLALAGELDELRAEVASLREQLTAQHQQQLQPRIGPDFDTPPGESSLSEPTTADSVRAALHRLLETENDAAVKDAVRRALNEVRAEERAERERAERAKNKDALMKLIGNRLTELRTELGLSDDQINRINDLAIDFVDDRAAAAANGASADELAAMDRGVQRGVRDIMGDATYREYRKSEISRAGRPLVGMALATVGLDAQQWDNVNRFLDGHIDRVVDSDVRLQTEEMTPAARKQLKDEMDAANQAAWQTMLDQYLTDEQRSRVPNRK